jgi:hypothetical protein
MDSLKNKCFLLIFFQGNLESSYVKSVLDIYELVLQTSSNFKNDSTDKVKQEVLRGLGKHIASICLSPSIRYCN